VLERIDEVLSAARGPEPPMRNSSGAMCEIRNRHVAGLHMLATGSAGDEVRVPAPAEPLIRELDADSTLLAMEKHIRFEQTDKHGKVSNVQLHMPFVRSYRTYSKSKLPIVTGVVTAPLVTETGVLASPGLDRERGLYFSFDPMLGRVVPELGTVSDDAAKEAYRFLANDFFCDVQTSDQGKALAIAAMLTVLERPLLPERPAFFITAGQRGGGKTTLANIISLGTLGRHASAAGWSHDEGERKKALFAYLREGPATIVWDNILVGSAITSSAVEAALTMPTVSGRILGLSEQLSVPATTVQFFTGNNISPTGDMASRSFVIPLDVDRPDPENREFKHPDWSRWILDNRPRILRSLYTVLVWNLQRGADNSPPAKTRFKTWWVLCGRPVEDIAGLLGVKVDFAGMLNARESEDSAVIALATLLECLKAEFEDRSFTAQEVKEFGECAGTADSTPGLSIRALLEQATGKQFRRQEFDARPWGQRLGRIIGKPVAVDAGVLTLERGMLDGKRGNTYGIKLVSRQ
jgi:hypothetical protein